VKGKEMDEEETGLESAIKQLIALKRTYDFGVWSEVNVEDVTALLMRYQEWMRAQGASRPWLNFAQLVDSFAIDPRIDDPVTKIVQEAIAIYSHGMPDD
jgi:hypothetical protein